MAKKSTKSSEPEAIQPVAIEPETASKPKTKAKKAVKRAKKVATPEVGEVASEAAAPEPAPEPEALMELVEESAAAPVDSQAQGEAESGETDTEGSEDEVPATPRPPAKLERLQKILAQAGVASRRKAEELIEQGRVQVNGKIVTALGTKADAGRDHIRVDGKLLHGAERLRYFVLNKPKGYVTTVKDPEGRPTVMQFFEKMRERLYPVGRLDYMSEGLLLVTNDGELANKLTRASAGVEKTYLVKVAGVPTESELDLLRSGVAIERGKPGSDKVRTAPARIRQVRQGDNPWYEVVLIEGRNRELRKMFEEVGHFVEKIRRVGYGPLVLDQEPGNLRELDEQELNLLRKAADGTLRTPKAKEIRRRNEFDKQLPTVRPKPSVPRPGQTFGAKPFAAKPLSAKPFGSKSFDERPALGPKDYQPKPRFESRSGADRPNRPAGKEFGSPRPAWKKDSRPPFKKDDRPAFRSEERPTRPEWKKDDRPARPAARFGAGEGRPAENRPFTSRPASRPGARPFGDKPAWKKPEGQGRPAFKRAGERPGGRPAERPAPQRREVDHDDFGPVRPPNLHIEEVTGQQERPSRFGQGRAGQGRTGPARPYGDRPSSGRPGARPPFERQSSERPRPPFRAEGGRSGSGPSGSGRSSSDRPGSARPFRGEGGLARPFTTSSGKPRAGGARPNSKPGGKPFAGGPKRGPDSRATGKPGWKPKPSFGAKPGGGKGRPAFKSGPKPGGKRPGSFGKKRP
jgi:23S rRNA pseudouridine2605 synthase